MCLGQPACRQPKTDQVSPSHECLACAPVSPLFEPHLWNSSRHSVALRLLVRWVVCKTSERRF